MYLLLSQADINTGLIIFLLSVILFVILKGPQFFYTYFVRPKEPTATQNYLNTQAKIRSIEYAPSTIVTSDIDGKIVAWTGSGNVMFGWRESEILGMNVNIIVPPEFREAHDKGMQRVKDTGQTRLMGKTLLLTGYKKDLSRFPIELTIWQWSDNTNKYYTAIIRDITIDVEAKNKIDNMLQLFHKAEEITEAGAWNWDVVSDLVLTSPGYDRIFDLEHSDQPHKSSHYMKRVYHEDRKALQDVLENAFTTKKGYRTSYRVAQNDGSTCRVGVVAEPILNKNNQLTNIVGIIYREKKP